MGLCGCQKRLSHDVPHNVGKPLAASPSPRVAESLSMRPMIRRVARSRCMSRTRAGQLCCQDASSVRRYPGSARAVLAAETPNWSWPRARVHGSPWQQGRYPMAAASAPNSTDCPTASRITWPDVPTVCHRAADVQAVHAETRHTATMEGIDFANFGAAVSAQRRRALPELARTGSPQMNRAREHEVATGSDVPDTRIDLLQELNEPADFLANDQIADRSAIAVDPRRHVPRRNCRFLRWFCRLFDLEPVFPATQHGRVRDGVPSRGCSVTSYRKNRRRAERREDD